jgi:cell division septal protein FtsQ
MGNRKRRRHTSSEARRRIRLPSMRKWFTLTRVWSVLALLAVLVLILSLIAPAFTPGV